MKRFPAEVAHQWVLATFLALFMNVFLALYLPLSLIFFVGAIICVMWGLSKRISSLGIVTCLFLAGMTLSYFRIIAGADIILFTVMPGMVVGKIYLVIPVIERFGHYLTLLFDHKALLIALIVLLGAGIHELFPLKIMRFLMALLGIGVSIFYIEAYRLDLFIALGMAIVYGIMTISNNINHTRYWILIFAMTTLFFSTTLAHVYPYEKLDEVVQKILPDLIKKYEKAVESEDKTSSTGPFDFKDTLYYPLQNRLGGPITEKSLKTIFEVRSTVTPLYLRGMVYTHYNGLSWQRGPQMLRIPYRDVPVNEDLKSVTIKEVDYHSSTIFAPLDSVYTDRKAGGHDTYTVYYRDKAVDTGRSSVSSSEIIKSGRPKIEQLAKEIGRGKLTDRSKLEAIKTYLKDHYDYTLDVSVPPVDQDFAEFFLFEEKKGYCTYFATAVTLLARDLDIPSRYVEGFVVSPKKASRGLFYVTAKEAHAWSEVYVEGEGWQVLDATPAFEADFVDQDQPLLETVVDPRDQEVTPEDPLKTTSIQKRFYQRPWFPWVILALLVQLSYFVSRQLLLGRSGRAGDIRRLYYFEYLYDKRFKSDVAHKSVPRKIKDYFHQEVDSEILAFDGIIEISEKILYGTTEESVPRQFVLLFEKKYFGLLERYLYTFSYWKGWI